MDFAYTEEQEAVRELAGRIFGDRATHERLKAVEAAEAARPEAERRGPFDRELWRELADAGLLGIGLGEDVGGAGLDFVATCLVVEAAGRHAAYVPVVETTVLGAGTLERYGTAAQRERWLPGVASGERVLTAATAELVGDLVVPGLVAPTTIATRRAPGQWVLDGTKACVAAGLLADQILVPASLVGSDGQSAGVGVLVVDGDAAGLRRVAQETTSGRTEAVLELDGVVVDDDALVGGSEADGRAIVADLADLADRADLADLAERSMAALCVLQAGACAAAVALISEYTKTREQFGKPIATFQAVGQRAADAYVDAEGVRLTAWQAAWRLAAGLPAGAEVAIAKFWAAEGGQRVVHAAQHLHGGIGVDRDYPLHRYFLLTEQIELTLGSAADSLRRLGALLAAQPV